MDPQRFCKLTRLVHLRDDVAASDEGAVDAAAQACKGCMTTLAIVAAVVCDARLAAPALRTLIPFG